MHIYTHIRTGWPVIPPRCLFTLIYSHIHTGWPENPSRCICHIYIHIHTGWTANPPRCIYTLIYIHDVQHTNERTEQHGKFQQNQSQQIILTKRDIYIYYISAAEALAETSV